MAVSKIICPECQTVLRPAKPLPPGKSVKCPECGNRFPAPADEPAPAPKKKPAPAGGIAAPKKTKNDAAAKAPPKKSAAVRPAKPADEDGGTYSFADGHANEDEDKPDINYAPDMSIKDLRGPAQSALVQPTNALIAVGGLGFFGWVALMIVYLIPVVFPIEKDEGDKNNPKPVVKVEHGLGAVNDTTEPTAEPKPKGTGGSLLATLFLLDSSGAPRLPPLLFFVYLLLMVLGMAYSCFLTYGAVKIQNLEGYGWGIAACVMAIISVFNMWGLASCSKQLGAFLMGMVIDDPSFLWSTLIGVMSIEILAGSGVGVWVLMTLLSEKVVKGYEYKAD